MAIEASEAQPPKSNKAKPTTKRRRRRIHPVPPATSKDTAAAQALVATTVGTPRADKAEDGNQGPDNKPATQARRPAKRTLKRRTRGGAPPPTPAATTPAENRPATPDRDAPASAPDKPGKSRHRRRKKIHPAHDVGAPDTPATSGGRATSAPEATTTPSRPAPGKSRPRPARKKRRPAAVAAAAEPRKPETIAPVAGDADAVAKARPDAEPAPREPSRRRRKRKPKSEDRPAPPPVQAEPAPVKAPIRRIAKLSTPKSGREMIINVTGNDECRIAITEGGRLEELFIERQSAESHVGNIYKGRVTNVEPSIQAAFVDFGFPKNGFLHVSDVQPQYFPNSSGQPEAVGKKVPRRDRPPIQRCFRRGQEVIVQITKEGVGTKGPTLTTYLSIPGRFLVMMPGMDRLGVSRKIEDEDARRKMRDVMSQLSFPERMGFILRTAGLDQSKRELQRDLNYLTRLWKNVNDQIQNTSPPAELYQESDLVIRTLRDVYTSDFERVIVDNPDTCDKAEEFLRIAAPRSSSVVELYADPKPIFHAFGIEDQIDLINSRHVPLPSGGTLVIDPTEAMVAIDVNSGKFRDLDDAEETAYKINMEAAEEVARQLRLRDLGGLIVCDFIDMRFDRHKRAVEKVLRDALKKHKERARILRMSQFGLIEMTRQRQRPSIKRGIFTDCSHCRGSGLVKTPESMSLEVMRILQLAAHRRDIYSIVLTASPTVALMVLNDRRAALYGLQEETKKNITVQANPAFTPDEIQCLCQDNRGRPVAFKP